MGRYTSRALAIVIFAVAVAGCSKDMATTRAELRGRLAGVDAIIVRTEVYQQHEFQVVTETRAQGARYGFEDGWQTPCCASAFDLFLWPVTASVAAAGGAIVGAAAGSGHRETEIADAATSLRRAVAGSTLDKRFERGLTQDLRRHVGKQNIKCVTSSIRQGGCDKSAVPAIMYVSLGYDLVQPAQPATGGRVDLSAYISTVVRPVGSKNWTCATWRFRTHMGNLFALAANDGAETKRQLSAAFDKLASRIADAYLAEPGVEAWVRTNFHPIPNNQDLCDYNAERAGDI